MRRNLGETLKLAAGCFLHVVDFSGESILQAQIFAAQACLGRKAERL